MGVLNLFATFIMAIIFAILLNELKSKHQIGDEMKLKINRNGQEKEIALQLGEQP